MQLELIANLQVVNLLATINALVCSEAHSMNEYAVDAIRVNVQCGLMQCSMTTEQILESLK